MIFFKDFKDLKVSKVFKVLKKNYAFTCFSHKN